MNSWDIIHEMTDEQFEAYLSSLKEKYLRKNPIPITYYPVKDGIIQCKNEEEWDEE